MYKIEVRLKDIQWGTDGESASRLPTGMTFLVRAEDNMDAIDQAVELASDATGWLMTGFNHELVEE